MRWASQAALKERVPEWNVTFPFMLPSILLFILIAAFLILERIRPGRILPDSPSWYYRILLINLVQAGISFSTNTLWVKIFGPHALLKLSLFHNPLLEGFIGWLVGGFVFYWWHRLRHADGFWRVFHQLHHSPQRIEALTSFYKHPVEILSDALLSGAMLFLLLGASPEAIFWFNFFATLGEYFYHANIKTHPWIRYIIQTPELHSVHHQLDVHKFNFSDFPVWDRLFGTYRDAVEFAPQCGFPRNNERMIFKILIFRDVYYKN